jgi:hypothetical protein
MLGLTDTEENQIVTFLMTLTDGYTTPYPDINTYTGTCMTGGTAATQGNSSLLQVPAAMGVPCASAVCGVTPFPSPPIAPLLKGLSMTNRFLLTLAMTSAAGSFALSRPATAQLLPPIKKAGHVQITQGPEPERADNYLTIIRWTSSNPRGTDRHLGVVHYGTDPKNLDQVAKSPIQLNRFHSETVFRVRMPPLKGGTTYYYTVDEEESTGESDKLQSPVKSFTVKAYTFPSAPEGH